MWKTFAQGQEAVNVDHMVSARVSGWENRCQVIFTDTLGTEHTSPWYQSFSEAEDMLQRFVEGYNFREKED